MLADILAARDADALNGHFPTVLVVEDEDIVRMSAVEFLRFSDYQVLEAATADEALTLLASGADVDLVFTDIRMPGRMDGLDLARWLRSHHPALPVLLTSGYAGTARDAKPTHPLLPKPYSLDGLVRKVGEMLSPRIS